MEREWMVRNVEIRDAAALCGIYNHYVANTIVTFEEQAVAIDEMEHRIAQVSGLFPWLVLEMEGTVAGYAYARPWKDRSAFRHTVESSVYVAPDKFRCGIGTKLYSALLPALGSLGIHSVVAGIALPNPGSVAMHEKLGFQKAAHFKAVGRKFGQWIDLGCWELVFPG